MVSPILDTEIKANLFISIKSAIATSKYLTFISTVAKTNSKENYVNSCCQAQKIDDVRLENA